MNESLSPVNAMVLAAPQSAALTTPNGEPKDIYDMLGPINKDDLIVIVKQAKKTELDAAITVSVGKLGKLEAAIAAANAQLATIGPQLCAAIDLSKYEAAAKALKAAGLGAYKVAVAFKGRDEKARRYDYEVTIKQSSSYSAEHSKTVSKPLTAETKKLHKTLAALKASVTKQNAELMGLKNDISRLDDLAEAAHAELATMIARRTNSGRDILNRLLALKQAAQAPATES